MTSELAPSTSSQEVKNFITNKFATLPRFAALVGTTGPALSALFKRKHYSSELGAVYELAKKTKAATPCFELTDQDRERLAKYLKKHHNGNASAFARALPNVDGMTVAHILSGQRKRKTPVVKAVFAAAGLALSDSCPPKPAAKVVAAGKKLA